MAQRPKRLFDVVAQGSRDDDGKAATIIAARRRQHLPFSRV
jgi:hypothetical protein